MGYLLLGRVLFPFLEYCRSTCGLYVIRKLLMQTYIMYTYIYVQAGAIECMCMALKQFPKKKDSVLSLCAPVCFFHAPVLATAHTDGGGGGMLSHPQLPGLFQVHFCVRCILTMFPPPRYTHGPHTMACRQLRMRFGCTKRISDYLSSTKGLTFSWQS